MKKPYNGNAIIYCEGAFNTPNGKTAHGLLRYSQRYKILSVIDSRYAKKDSGIVLDGQKNNIPVFGSLTESIQFCKNSMVSPTHFVIGLAPDGGQARSDYSATCTRSQGL